MKLNQLFSGETHTENTNTGRVQQQSPAQTAYLSHQVRSLVPGQTISGEIVGRNGSEVQIKLNEDMILNARVDRNLNIEVGKNMTFEVKSNGSSLTLSPLFTNVSTDVNVLKALDMAGLPVNETTVGMTEQLMAAGLPVNRNSLLQIYREINSFPQGQISDIINLHKLQMPVNEANVSQMASYRNLTHQLLDGMNTIMGALPEVFDSMMASGDAAGAARLYQELFLLVQEGAGAQPGAGGLTGEAAVLEQLAMGAGASGENNALNAATVTVPGSAAQLAPGIGQEPFTQGMTPQNPLDALIQGMMSENGEAAQNALQGMAPEAETVMAQNSANAEVLQGGEASGAARNQITANADLQESGSAASISAGVRAAVAGEVLELLDSLQMPSSQAAVIRSQVMQFAQGQGNVNQLFSNLNLLTAAAGFSPEGMQALGRLFSRQEFRGLLTGQLKNLWTVTPEEVSEPGRVEELYRRLDRQLEGLSKALENAGQTDSTAFRAVNAMSQNIDFLQQINQMYTYVQLPLRLQQGDAHGELYVYTNKRRLTDNDGKVSALLHLDMEHLGLVDVYVTMQSSKVSTKFYVSDDEMLDFLAGHMDLLIQRLKKRGYDYSYEMTARGKDGEAAESGLNPVLRQEKGIALTQYAFDVRT